MVEVFRMAICGGDAGGTRRGRAGSIEDTRKGWDIMRSKRDTVRAGKEGKTFQVCRGLFELLPSLG